MGAGPSKVVEKEVKAVAEDLGWDDAPAGASEETEEKDEKAASSLSETDVKDAQVSDPLRSDSLTLYFMF
jgi:hypothetical protein